MGDLKFNHIECDKDGKAQLTFFTESGRVRHIALSDRDLATLVTDAGVVLTSKENLKITKMTST